MSVAEDINDYGVVVGESNGRAVLWRNGHIVDLNALIAGQLDVTLVTAVGINDSGQIIAQSGSLSTRSRGFLLDPIPEPTVPISIAIGFGMGWWVLRSSIPTSRRSAPAASFS